MADGETTRGRPASSEGAGSEAVTIFTGRASTDSITAYCGYRPQAGSRAASLARAAGHGIRTFCKYCVPRIKDAEWYSATA